MPNPQSSPQRKGALHSFKETIESLVIAFILAFVFRAFVVEAFVIPTGSMADTLRGAHFNLTCPTCGYQYHFGFNPEYYLIPGSRQQSFDKGTIPPYPIDVAPNRIGANIRPSCPICNDQSNAKIKLQPSSGDRILVMKYIYQFVDPKIWDVVVFKNPTNPTENYIKRLIGRPGDKVEIIDGDIYINDLIQPKPDHIQNALWIKIYDHDLLPEKKSDSPIWKQPFQTDETNGHWQIDAGRRRLDFQGSDQPEILIFDPEQLKYKLQSFCAYNGSSVDYRALASDVKLQFILSPGDDQGNLSLQLSKYGRTYRLDIDFQGTCFITSEFTGEILAQGSCPPLRKDHPVQISFAILDHQLLANIGRTRLAYAGANRPQDWGYQSMVFHSDEQTLPNLHPALREGDKILCKEVTSNGQPKWSFLAPDTFNRLPSFDEAEYFIIQQLPKHITFKQMKDLYQEKFGRELTNNYLTRFLNEQLAVNNLLEPRPVSSASLVGQKGNFTIRHLAIYRDIHYSNSPNGPWHAGRGTEGDPFTLNPDEFFVLGDNSLASHDSRFWDEPGLGNGREYRMGVVPRDYLIGRALFVYWPAGFQIDRNFRFAIIPNVGEMRFIH